MTELGGGHFDDHLYVNGYIFPLRYISDKILGKWVCPISGEVCVFAFGLDHGRFKHFVELVSMMLQYVDTKFLYIFIT